MSDYFIDFEYYDCYPGLVSTNNVTSLNQPLVGLWDNCGSVVADTLSVLENQIVPIVPYGMIAMDARYSLPFINCHLNYLYLYNISLNV
jgi:hypothetical protein